VSSTLLRGVRLVDPASGWDSGRELSDVRLVGGRIAEVAPRLPPRPGEGVVDLQGACLAPGGFDPHVHFREPGQSHKETLETGAAAAVAGGFSEVAVMPNTEPALDEAHRVRGVVARGEAIGLARLRVIAACTAGLAGERLAEMLALAEAGAIGFSDDGRPVADALRMRRALEWAAIAGKPLVTHAEIPELRGRGAMHEGAVSGRLGVPGIPVVCETAAVARDLELAALTGARLHVAHLSTARAVEMVREAKRRGLRVTAETAPHYLCFTDETVAAKGTAAKMNPPLRSEADRAALRAGIADGTIDCLATDHAPHAPEEKEVPFEEAPFGVVGLETAWAAALTALHHEDGLPLARVAALLTTAPCRIFGLAAWGLAPGEPADLVAFDPDVEWLVDPEAFHTKGRHTPFAGTSLRGRVLGTWIAGERVFTRSREEAADGGSRGVVEPLPAPAATGGGT
jgi:dihydroorotase